MRNRTLLTIVLAGALVGACGGADDEGETASSTSTGAPATTVAVSSTTAGSGATSTTFVPSSSTINDDSYLDFRGLPPVLVGMTLAQATAAAGIPVVAPSDTAECTYATAQGGPAGVSFMLVDRRIARVDVRDDSKVQALGGSGIGYTEDHIKLLYPDIKVSPHKYVPGGHYLTVVPEAAADQNFRLIFETDGLQVTSLRAGKLPEVELVEGCS
jgi:hypothetical protein